MYHSVARGDANPYLDDTSFALQMDMLASEFRVLGADEYLWHRRTERRFPTRSVLVTFDDGYRNNARIVQPIMEARGLPWVLFTTTELLEDPARLLWPAALRAACLFARQSRVRLLGQDWALGDDEERRLGVARGIVGRLQRSGSFAELQSVGDWAASQWADVPDAYAESFCAMLTGEDLRRLAASPLVEIGCHTRTHPFLTCIEAQRLSIELDEATANLAAFLGRRVRMFAYPGGVYGERELARVSSLGFDCAFAVIPTLGQAPRFEIPRVGIYRPSTALARAKALGIAAPLRATGLPVG
jgi:peptidoglycan/xylan/chitin deacetylase (PgdA/CDA1 family)